MSSDRWMLRVLDSDGRLLSEARASAGVTIGRGQANQIVVPDRTVSSLHAAIESIAGELVLQDMGSQNGTEIDGGPLLGKGDTIPLKDGLRLRMGNSVIEVVDAALGMALDSNATMPGPDVQSGGQVPPPPVVVPPPAVPQPPEPARAQTPQPPPAPAPAPAPVVSPPVPAKVPGQIERGPGGLDEQESGLIQTLLGDSGGPGADVAAKHLVRALHARLVVLDEANKRVLHLTEAVTTIGRKSDSHLHVDSRSISYEHALITFSVGTSAFQLEDRGSANGTILQRVTLTPNIAQHLAADSALQFGPIEAVFRVDHEADHSQGGSEFDTRVAERLSDKGKLTKGALAAARKSADRAGSPLGDVLLLEGAVQPVAWGEACHDVRLLPVTTNSKNRWPWIAAALITVLVVAYVASDQGWIFAPDVSE